MQFLLTSETHVIKKAKKEKQTGDREKEKGRMIKKQNSVRRSGERERERESSTSFVFLSLYYVMMGSMKIGALPKGYRFRPTDEELVSHYLRLKINGRHAEVDVIPEVDVCKWEPWDLPALSVIKSDDPEWFFLCPRDKKYPNGHRSNRATEAGYWKATGKDRSIKSRKGHSDSQLIGMKKTLVFHKGRAPKGERTNWIMHEYRATEPDLDGTGPGQVDYVLCRLFHKTDEKLENSKYDGAGHTGSFPSPEKSSPDDVSSGVFRDPAMLDMQIVKEPEDIKKWLTVDEAGCMTPTNPAPDESCASDGVDHSGEETAKEVYVPLREASMSEEATYNQFEGKVLDSLLSQSYSDLGACVGSPFADNFGSEQNGSIFQDGASEQDASLSELLEGLQTNGNYIDEESTSARTNLFMREICKAGYIDGPKQTPLSIREVDDCKLHMETDKKMVQPQGQIYPSFSQFAPSTYQSHSRYAVEEVDSSVHTAKGSFYKPLETFDHAGTIKGENTAASQSGIKFQSRQPRNQKSSSTQGTAPRRIHLGVDLSGLSSKKEVTKDIDRAPNSRDSEDEILNENEESDKIRNSRPAGKRGQNRIGKMRSFMLPASFSARQSSNCMKRYYFGVHLVMILLVVFVGMWICPRSQSASSA